MQQHNFISSLQNPLVKQVYKLQQKPAERRKTGLFIVEGRREVSLAMSHRIETVQLLICSDIYREDPSYPIIIGSNQRLSYVSRAVYNKLAYREDAERVIMVGVQRLLSLNDLLIPDKALILVLEGVEKPGNLGAVLRTADAAGADVVILVDSATDIYNPNAVRASLGCVFTIPVVSCSSHETIEWLNDPAWWRDKLPAIYAAALQTSDAYYDVNMKGATALAFGAEDKGLSDTWRRAAHCIIKIPMSGAIDSLNVAASVAVMCFEARRQRNTAG